MIRRSTTLLTIGLLFLGYKAFTQDLAKNFKIWSGVGLSYPVTEKFDLKLSQLLALNTSPSRYSFSQTKLSAVYELKRWTKVEVGFVKGLFNDTNSLRDQGAYESWFNKLSVDRVYGNFSYRHELVKRLSMRHEIEYQKFFQDLDKYANRTLYTNRIIYNIRRTSFTPYIENQFFYYSGGIISNGIKRFRFKPGFTFKPIKDSSFRTTIYFIIQDEFKTDELSDNDYAVVGIHLSFKLK